MRYALSLNGVTAAVIGTDSLEVIEKNAETIRNFEPLNQHKMNELHVSLDPFYRSKQLPWMQPGYYDGLHIA